MDKPDSVARGASLLDYLKSWPLYFIPHHLISRIIFKLTRMSLGKNRVIRWFVRQFKVDMSEAAEPDITQYATFNEFFTRKLRSGARPISSDIKHIVCPADGAVSAVGEIQDGSIFQAKGRSYTLLELLGGNIDEATLFMNGRFATIYLSPRDYHRVHMPYAGRLRAQTHIPGRLFSVAPHTARTVPRLFARNERLVCYFDTPIGAMALVMVGAINVAAIETVWDGLVTPPAGKKILHVDYHSKNAIDLTRGAEMGRFNMGSTVIVLFENPVIWNSRLAAGDKVRMGQQVALTPLDRQNVILA